jgi:hypothetical protein
VIDPVRTWCGLREDGHLLAWVKSRNSQVSGSFPCGVVPTDDSEQVWQEALKKVEESKNLVE